MLEVCLAREIATHRLATELREILQDGEVVQPVREAAVLPRKERYTVEEAELLVRTIVLCGWLQSQVEGLRSNDHRGTIQACLRAVGTGGGGEGPRNRLKNEQTLLTRIKNLREIGDLRQLLALYKAAALFQAKKLVVDTALRLPEAAGLDCMRVIHCILRKDGGILFTAVRATE